MEFKEITAKTVDDAITKACLELETSSDNLEIQVVREGTSGFFGFGSKSAIIKVRKKVEEKEFDILEELKKEDRKETTKKEVKKDSKKEPHKETVKDTKKENVRPQKKERKPAVKENTVKREEKAAKPAAKPEVKREERKPVVRTEEQINAMICPGAICPGSRQGLPSESRWRPPAGIFPRRNCGSSW